MQQQAARITDKVPLSAAEWELPDGLARRMVCNSQNLRPKHDIAV